MSELRTPPPPPKPGQKRKHERYELMASVELVSGSETLVLAARNVSMGGIFVACDGNDLTGLKIGSEVELMVFDAQADDSAAVRATAEVVRRDGTGVGLRWKDDKQMASQLAALLSSFGAS